MEFNEYLEIFEKPFLRKCESVLPAVGKTFCVNDDISWKKHQFQIERAGKTIQQEFFLDCLCICTLLEEARVLAAKSWLR